VEYRKRGEQMMRSWRIGIAFLAVAWLMAASVRGAELKEARLNLEKAKLALSDARYQEAVGLLQEVLAAEPENTEALQYLGLGQIGLKDFKAAEQTLARALAQDPSLLNARLDRAWALIELKQPDPALAELLTALASEPDYPRAIYLQGQALLLKKDYAAAAAALEKAAGLDPKLAQSALAFAAACRDKMGDTEKAKEGFLNAQALDPSSPMGKAAADYLDQMEGKAKPEKARKFEAGALLSYQFDSNVAAVANEQTLPKGVEDEADGRGVVLASFVARPLTAQNWTTEARYYFYASKHFELDEYNLMLHQGVLGATYGTKLSRYPLRLRLRALYQWSGLGENYEYYSAIWRILPTALLQESERSLTEFSYAVETEKFEDPGEGELDRDNVADQILLAQHLGFLQNRGWLKLGVRFTSVDADGQDYDSSRLAGLAQVRVPLWKKAQGLAGFEYEYREYINHPGNRRDEIFSYRGQMEQEIVKHLSVYLAGKINNHNSTLAGFDYDRNIYSVGLRGWY